MLRHARRRLHLHIFSDLDQSDDHFFLHSDFRRIRNWQRTDRLLARHFNDPRCVHWFGGLVAFPQQRRRAPSLPDHAGLDAAGESNFRRDHFRVWRYGSAPASRNMKTFIAILISAVTTLAAESTATQLFKIELPPPVAPKELLMDSPFGVNTAFNPDTPDLEARLDAMQQAGIKWGRQDFTWKRIEREKGNYNFEPYDELLEKCRAHAVQLFGNLTYGPDFYDTATESGVAAYADFARAAVKRYAGKIDHWQIWNEPNLGFHKGDPDAYARILSAGGKAIHEANPNAKVLGLNMAFCDVLWTEKILQRVPYDCFDIICFHPYRNPNAPEEKFDWWVLDQYVKRFHKELTPDYPLVHANLLEQTDALIDVMKKFGAPKPIWITEMCFNTHIHPYGVPELRSADLTVRFHVLAVASRTVEKAFCWTLKDLAKNPLN